MLWTWLTLGYTLAVCASSVLNATNSSVIQPEYNSNSFQYKGVTAGGWLVLEPYITPSLFKEVKGETPIDEYRYCQALGSDEAQKRLEEHWSTFYNELDFELMKSYGLNMVRLPIGYWAFQKLDNDPYVMGAQKYLDKALGWAKNNDLKVWIDLHGVPGTQNGFDNSGYRDIGHPGWFNSTENVNVTYQVLEKIFTKYGTGDLGKEYAETILGIEVVNEPFSPVLNESKIEEFYVKSYELARKTMIVNNTIVFHDAFKPIGYYNWFMNKRKSQLNSSVENYNIMIDHHHYEVFASSVSSNISEHITNINNYAQSIKGELQHHPAVVGEWSGALTDCTPWLNGVGLGSRYAGEAPYQSDFNKTGSCKNINNFKKWSNAHKKDTRKFLEVQLDQYSRYSNGWIFWCFKTEDTIEWDFKRLVEYELMPQPLDNFTYIKNGTDTDPSPEKSGASYTNVHLLALAAAIICGLI